VSDRAPSFAPWAVFDVRRYGGEAEGDMVQGALRSAPFAILFCAALVLFMRTFQFDFPRAPGRLGPDVWPQAILVLLMITCVIGMARNFFVRARPPGQAQQPSSAAPDDTLATDDDIPSRYGLVVLGLALFLAYPVALEYLGFLVATCLLMALFMRAGRWRNPLGVLVTAAVGTLVLFYVFRGIVYVSLPLGTGPFQDFTVFVADLLRMR
jgi:putative tricarboxylic transport membrane protein